MTDSPRKTICFVNSNKAWGGGEKWHFETANELRRRGYDVLLVSHVRSQLRSRATAAQLPTFPFRIGNLSFLNPAKLLALLLFFKVQKVDTVILNLPADLKCAGLAARLAGVKTIIYRRGMPHPLRNTWLNRFHFREVLTHVVVNSREIGRSLEQGNEAWFPRDKLALIYNGVDTTPAAPSTRLHEKQAGEWLIGNAGRLTAQKGQDHLIGMAGFLRREGIPFRLLIAGEGELRGKLQRQISEAKLDDCVTLLGQIGDMPRFLHSLDVFVFPSLYEGSANTLIEALHAGVPVVAFDVSSNPEIIQHERTGILVKPFDTPGLAAGVRQVMTSPGFREVLVVNGRELVRERFDRQRNLDLLETII